MSEVDFCPSRRHPPVLNNAAWTGLVGNEESQNPRPVLQHTFSLQCQTPRSEALVRARIRTVAAGTIRGRTVGRGGGDEMLKIRGTAIS